MKVLDIEIIYPEKTNQEDALAAAEETVRGCYSEYRVNILPKENHIHIQVFNVSQKDAEAALLINDRPIENKQDELFAYIRQRLGVKFIVKTYEVPEEGPK